MEEGPTSVFTARQWGYYENPDDIDHLIGWLDTRGNRELKLRKELVIQKDMIARYMENRKAYLTKREESRSLRQGCPREPRLMLMRRRTVV